MLDAFLRAVAQADARGDYISKSQIDALRAFSQSGKKRIDVVNQITDNASTIVTSAARSLFAEQPQLIAPGGNAYTSRRMAACLRDLEYILRYVTYAIFAGDASVLEDRCLNGLRETYMALGVPGASVAVAIQKMKVVTLELFGQQKSREEPKELTISQIRNWYPKQWVTIEITKFKNGFPSQGKVLYYDHDIDSLAEKIGKLNGANIYTFFTSRIDQKPERLVRKADSRSDLISLSEDPALVSEIASYFDRAVASVY